VRSHYGSTRPDANQFTGAACTLPADKTLLCYYCLQRFGAVWKQLLDEALTRNVTECYVIKSFVQGSDEKNNCYIVMNTSYYCMVSVHFNLSTLIWKQEAETHTDWKISPTSFFWIGRWRLTITDRWHAHSGQPTLCCYRLHHDDILATIFLKYEVPLLDFKTIRSTNPWWL